MAPIAASPPPDVPFTVRDRRRKGFFTIDNELLDRCGAQLGPYGLSVYMALARFANQDSACWPSLATIAQRTGMSRRQVIREIDKLQELLLVAVETQLDPKTGEHKANRYILLDTMGSDSQSPPSDTLSLPGSDSQSPPSDTLSPKQNLEKKTQHRNNPQRTTHARSDQEHTNNSAAHQTAGGGAISIAEAGPVSTKPTKKTSTKLFGVPSTPPPDSGEPPAPVVDRHHQSAEVLVAVGMTAKVAHRLAERYSLERIEEKVSYLDFLQAHQPEKVKNPCGWLRTAIEDDFAAPDGFLSAADQEQQRADSVALADFLLEPPEPSKSVPIVEAPDWSHVHVQYGTTDEDLHLWEQAKQALELMGRTYISTLLVDTLILQCTNDTALIGVPKAFNCAQLQHPQTVKLLERTLTQLAERPLTPMFVPL